MTAPGAAPVASGRGEPGADLTGAFLQRPGYPTDCAEKAKYLAAVDGGLWAFMVKAAGVVADLEDDEVKGTIKEDIFQQVFYSFSEGKAGTKGIYAKAFKREFPLLWAEINIAKKKHGPKQSSGLAREMQRTEAWAVFDAINSLEEKPYPLISIHDAVVTTQEGVDDVVAAMSNSFLPLGLAPRLATKVLTIGATQESETASASTKQIAHGNAKRIG